MAYHDSDLFRSFVSRRMDYSRAAATCILASLGDSKLVQDTMSFIGDRALRGTPRREIDPGSYSCADSFRRDYLAVNLLRKYPYGASTPKERSDRALEKFLDSERECQKTAYRLKYLQDSLLVENYTGASYIHMMREKIRGVLPPFKWQDAARFFGHGPGGTTRLLRKEGDPFFKFQGKPEATYNCADVASAFIHSCPLWVESIKDGESGPLPFNCVKVVGGDSVTTVPKDADIDRVICKQPDMNIFIQKGVGGLLRRYLFSRAKVNLNDQTPNQRLAREGSETGELATLDLRSASDCVSLELCRQVLPPDWFSAIELCRTYSGVLPDGRVIRYHKVSSMGNGFTFELESLIFWAVISAVRSLHPCAVRLPHSVYGDDLIVPKTLYGPVCSVLAFLGLSVNESKSFADGPFRESCGKHYFLGADVSPFHFREKVNTVERLYWCHNQYVLWLNRFRRCPVLLDNEQRVVDQLIDLCPARFRTFRIPFGTPEEGTYLGSVGFISKEPEPRLVTKQGWVRVRMIVTVRKSRPRGSLQYLLRQLYLLDKRGPAVPQEESPSGITMPQGRAKVVKTSVYRWDDPYLT